MTTLTLLPTVPDRERLARAWLAVRCEPGDPRVNRLVGEAGAVVAVERLAAGQVPGGTVAPVRPDADPWATGTAVLDDAARRGLRWICPGDDDWPTALDDLGHSEEVAGRGGAPHGLWVRGGRPLAALTATAVAVVGARASTEYGNDVAGDIAADLAEAGVTVISGAAYGIDAAAHRGALAVRGRTVAVLACGADVTYPRGHDALLGRIADQGLVVSEAPPGDHPTKVRFLARNRLIAAMASAVLVVEAAWRSGALNTLNWAGSLQRPALGVPGPVTSALSAGVHHAIRERRADLVTSGADVLDVLAPLGAPSVAGASGWGRGEHRPGDGLDRTARALLEALPATGAVPAATVAAAVGSTEPEALRVLGTLLARGLVERTGDGWRFAGRRGGLPGAGEPRTLPT